MDIVQPDSFPYVRLGAPRSFLGFPLFIGPIWEAYGSKGDGVYFLDGLQICTFLLATLWALCENFHTLLRSVYPKIF